MVLYQEIVQNFQVSEPGELIGDFDFCLWSAAMTDSCRIHNMANIRKQREKSTP